MSEKKRRPKVLPIILILILALPLISTLSLALYRPPRHFSSPFVNNTIDETADYAIDFQTEDGLFIEPAIDIIYHTISSFSILNGTGPFNFTDLNSENLTHYAFTRLNPDGGHSDFAGTGNIHSSHRVLMSLNLSAPDVIKQNPTEMNLTARFINSSQNADGGYVLRPSPEIPAEFNFELGAGIPVGQFSYEISTLQNTYEAIESLMLLGVAPPNASATAIFINESCRRLLPPFAGFSATKYTLEPDLQSTYYGVATLMQLGYSKSAIEKPFSNITLFIESCWNPIDGGFANFPGNASDITSTYYGVAALSLFAYNFSLSLIINRTRLISFISSCQNLDGGFGAWAGQKSDFQSAHHAVDALKLLQVGIYPFNLTNLHTWLLEHQALNGLFGEIIVTAQYWGVRSAFLSQKDDSLNDTVLVQFLASCQNPDGGFGARPNATSSVVDTYCALEALFLLKGLSQINSTAATQWLQSQQTAEGGFASQLGIDAFFASYGPIYGLIADYLLNESKSSTQATFFALAALRRLNAWPLNRTSLSLWLLTAQNPDGGFPFSIGIKSDAVSTFYAVQALVLINEQPFSSRSCLEFLKGCQTSDGGFTFSPLLGEYLNVSYLFVSYTASKGIYLLSTQPTDVFGALDWFLTCEDPVTNGYGDQPGFGADLRNSPYLIDIIGELNIDRSFAPAPWIQTSLWLLIVGVAIVGTFSLNKLLERRPKTIVSSIRRSHPNIEEYPALHVKNLTIKIGKRVILEDVNLTLHHGEVLGVIGESGAGKSTFVKAILGTKDSKGDIKIYGFDIRKEKKRLKPLFGYVPQDLSKIYENFTIMENLLHFGKQYGIPESEIINRGSKILRDLGILAKKDALISQLSGGQRRRASIAVGMIHQPILFVLDEPTSGLDPIIREQLWLNLIDLAEQHNTTLVVITHYPEESKFCTKVAIFGRKRGLIDFGHPAELIKNLPGTGRAIEISLDPRIQTVRVNLLPLLQKLSRFVLEEKRGTQYRIFSDLPMQSVKDMLVKSLGTELIKVKQSEATLIDYFRIKSLEVQG